MGPKSSLESPRTCTKTKWPLAQLIPYVMDLLAAAAVMSSMVVTTLASTLDYLIQDSCQKSTKIRHKNSSRDIWQNRFTATRWPSSSSSSGSIAAPTAPPRTQSPPFSIPKKVLYHKILHTKEILKALTSSHKSSEIVLLC